jgi:hypothetical protein
MARRGGGIVALELAVAGAALVCAIALACSSSKAPAAASASPCPADPSQCPAGTTCWLADSMSTLKCLPSNPGGGFGVSCMESIGQATCADGLVCDQLSAANGACTYYCGGAGRACPTGYTCFQTHVGMGGPTIDICRSGSPMIDGGPPPPDDGGGCDDCGIGPIPDASVDGGGMMM